jgi:hypothetical protein
VSTSPGTRRWWAARLAIVGATVFASITSTTAVVGLDNPESDAVGQAIVDTTAPIAPAARDADTTAANSVVSAVIAPNDPCGAYLADFCTEVEIPAPAPVEHVASCATGGEDTPTGITEVVPAAGPATEDALRIRFEIEGGLAIDPGCFAAEALEILNDERGWADVDGISFAAVEDDSYDLRLVLASPATTDTLCYPARTAGLYSCRTGSRVVINLMRWRSGTDDYAGHLTVYRQYLINHEVGHFLGRGHRQCPGAGEPAPVMMQQTKGLDQCVANGWPTEGER